MLNVQNKSNITETFLDIEAQKRVENIFTQLGISKCEMQQHGKTVAIVYINDMTVGEFMRAVWKIADVFMNRGIEVVCSYE